VSAATLKPFPSAALTALVSALIPRSRERGHIEAELPSETQERQGTIPRSRERGHIEAVMALAAAARRAGFRAHVSAATLKLVIALALTLSACVGDSALT